MRRVLKTATVAHARDCRYNGADLSGVAAFPWRRPIRSPRVRVPKLPD